MEFHIVDFPFVSQQNAAVKGNRNCAWIVALRLGLVQKGTYHSYVIHGFSKFVNLNWNQMVPKA